jgi:alcohol dehydrogenase class IV
MISTGEPSLPDLHAGLQSARDTAPDCVIAVGGGSVIDLGKALAALLPQAHPPLSYLEGVGDGRRLEANPLPFVALPTTSGTGAEVTKNAVIGVPEKGRKVSLRDDRMMPDLVCVDPTLTDGCPPSVTLASGLDAITQVIEPYISARANPLTDAICRAAIPTGLRALRLLLQREDPAARDDMAYVSLSGGMALANAGLGAVHGLAGVIGGKTGLAHGMICGRLLVPVLEQNLLELRATGGDTHKIDAVQAMLATELETPADKAFSGLQDWIDAAGLPHLPQVSSTSRHAWAVEAQTASSMKGNPVALSVTQLEAIIAISSR